MQGLSINFMRHSTFMIMNTGLGWAGLGWDGLLRHHVVVTKGTLLDHGTLSRVTGIAKTGT
jgi:hypothetical protein